MQSLTVEALDRWVGGQDARTDDTVGVLHGAAGPLNGFRMAVAAWVLGYAYVGALADASPALLPAFASDLAEKAAAPPLRFAEENDVLDQADLLMARPEDDADALRERCGDSGIPERKRLIQPPVVSVGVIDGHESDDERERLAEDMLLFDGTGRRRLAVLWAPADLTPDPYLESMARFRGVYPAHADTPGALQMQQAFLEARDESHAYAEGLEFLVSRGEPVPKKAGHVRWAEYDELEEVEAWADEHKEDVYALVARPGLHDRVSGRCSLRSPGGAHIPPLDDWEGATMAQFLTQES